MNLSNPLNRQFSDKGKFFYDFPMDQAKIFEGSAVSNKIVSAAATGIAETLAAGEDFLGFAVTTFDNTAGTPGSANISLQVEGIVQIPVVGVTGAANLEAVVYASDGNTFTLTATNNSPIGKIVGIVSGTLCAVKFKSTCFQVG